MGPRTDALIESAAAWTLIVGAIVVVTIANRLLFA